MMKPTKEWICGLPFHSPSNNMEEFMTIGTLIEELIYLKRKYDICYPDDNYINSVCNILERMPQNIEIAELLKSKENF